MQNMNNNLVIVMKLKRKMKINFQILNHRFKITCFQKFSIKKSYLQNKSKKLIFQKKRH